MSGALRGTVQESAPRTTKHNTSPIKRIGAIAAVVAATAAMAACRPAHTESTPVSPSTVASPSKSPETPAVNRVPRSLPHVTLTPGPVQWGPYAFAHAGGRQEVDATGAKVTLSQERPYVSGDGHSLMELSVQTADQQQTVEVGWRVREETKGDTQPHLFVYHWVDGQTSCYNGCGFVQVSDEIHPGDPVEVGKTGDYGIAHKDGKWNVTYNGELVGYYPDELWDGRFPSAQLVQAFGEVATLPDQPCTDMGNGLPGSDPGAAHISNFALEGTTVQPNLSPLHTIPEYYSYGQSTPTSLYIGGAGGC